MVQEFDFHNVERDFMYARAPHTKANVKYGAPIGGALENQYDESIQEYDYVSLISKERYTAGTEVEVSCYFEGSGAPCIVFTDDLGEGISFPEYGLHFEICIYQGGVNVWHILPNKERVECPITPTKLFFEQWEVSKTGVDCTVKFGRNSFTVLVEGHSFTVANEDFPEQFRVGFTACEGPCGFTRFCVKSDGAL